MEKISYEEASKELEEIVAKLESGLLPMSEAVKLFERGQDLVKVCATELESAKGKLTIIKENLNTLIEE